MSIRAVNIVAGIEPGDVSSGESAADERLIVSVTAPGTGYKHVVLDLAAGYLDSTGEGLVSLYAASGVTVSGVNLTFAHAVPDTIVRASGNFATAGVLDDDLVIVADSAKNDGTYLIASAVTDTITLDAAEVLTADGPESGDTLTFMSRFWRMPVLGHGQMFSFATLPRFVGENEVVAVVLTGGGGTAVGYVNLATKTMGV